MTENETVLWLDDDTNKLRVVEDLLGDSRVKIKFVRSVDEAVDSIKRGTQSHVLFLDAIVPMSRIENRSRFSSGSSRVDETSPCIPFRDLEKGGLRFLDSCRELGFSFSKVVILLYVNEENLRKLGYRFDNYVNKLSLPDRIDALRSIVLDSIENSCDAVSAT